MSMLGGSSLQMSGASSSASSKSGLGDQSTKTDGQRGVYLNFSTGSSRLAASTGGGLDTQTMLMMGAVVLGGLYLLKRKGG